MQRRQALLDRHPDWSRYVFSRRSETAMLRVMRRRAKYVRRNPQAVLCGHGHHRAVHEFAMRNGWRLYERHGAWVLSQPTE